MAGKNEVSRRGFIRTTGSAVVGAGVTTGSAEHVKAEEGAAQELRIQAHRTLGRTGFQVLDIGMGTGFLINSNVLALAHQNLTLA